MLESAVRISSFHEEVGFLRAYDVENDEMRDESCMVARFEESKEGDKGCYEAIETCN